MNFEGKVAMITGASVGIGRACAIRFSEMGAKLVLLDYNAETLAALSEELKARHADDALTFACDVGDEAAVQAAVSQALQRFGRIDILVNNAALWRCWSSFIDTPASEWEKFIRINVMGVVHCTKAVLGGMIERGCGRIVNVGSVAGVYGNANMVHYSATKGALIALTKGLAKEVADKGVTVNCVSPGVILTDMTRVVGDETLRELAGQTPLGRNGTPQDVANAMLYLAQADFVTGQLLPVNGGFVL